MNFKGFIKQYPILVDVYRKYKRTSTKRRNRRIFSELENTANPNGRYISKALKSLQSNLSQIEYEFINKIEAERKRLNNCKDVLNDETLGEGGLYDNGHTVEEVCKVSKSPKPALLLFLLTRTINPINVIELGTNVGISSAYIAVALKLNDMNGKVTTLDASPYRQQIAKKVHHNLGLENVSYVQGLFTETLTHSLTEAGTIDLAFIDGHHQYQPTLAYFEEILKFSRPNTVFVFDDIRWSDGMKKAWTKIQSDNRLGLVVDLGSVGVCTNRNNRNDQHIVFEQIQPF